MPNNLDELTINISNKDRRTILNRTLEDRKLSLETTAGLWICLISCFVLSFTSLRDFMVSYGFDIWEMVTGSILLLSGLFFSVILIVEPLARWHQAKMDFPPETKLVISDKEIKVGQDSMQKEEISEIFELEEVLFVMRNEGGQYDGRLIVPFFRPIRQEVLALLQKYEYPAIEPISSYQDVSTRHKEDS